MNELVVLLFIKDCIIVLCHAAFSWTLRDCPDCQSYGDGTDDSRSYLEMQSTGKFKQTFISTRSNRNLLACMFNSMMMSYLAKLVLIVGALFAGTTLKLVFLYNFSYIM